MSAAMGALGYGSDWNMNLWFWVLAGIVVGGAAVWLIMEKRRRELDRALRDAEQRAAAAEATSRALRVEAQKGEQEVAGLREKLEVEQKARATAEALREAEKKNLEDQRRLLEQAREKLTESFKALSSDVLGSQSESFLKLADQTFGKLRGEADGDLARRQDAIQNLVKPLEEALRRYDDAVKRVEGDRKETFGKLEGCLGQLGSTQEQLKQETAKLVNALRKPQVRGRWGEISLRRLAELSGMVDHCDFLEQRAIDWGEGTIRPDMVVRLPGGREVIVDSKVALDAYLDALEAPSSDLREQHLTRHAAQVRSHMEQLGSKSYWERLPRAPEFVLLFLPGDPFLGAAVERDPTLIEDGMLRRVVISTPSTLIALLLAVHHGWRQEQVEKNALEISELGKQLYDRLATFVGHFQALGSALGRAAKAYNEATGSLESRVLISARKFRDLGAATGQPMGEIAPIELVPRAVNVPERATETEGVGENLAIDFSPVAADAGTGENPDPEHGA